MHVKRRYNNNTMAAANKVPFAVVPGAIQEDSYLDYRTEENKEFFYHVTKSFIETRYDLTPGRLNIHHAAQGQSF
jgi:hypothetical protein